MPVAKLPLYQTVDASQCERSWRSSALALLTSTVVEALVIVTLIVTPLLVAQAMPEPVNQYTLPDFVPARIEIPVERAPTPPTAARSRPSNRAPRVDADVFVPPIDVPDGIPETDDYFSSDASTGVPGGVPSWAGGTPLPAEPATEKKAPPEPILIVGDIRPPRKVVHVSPVYPPVALIAKLQGTVKLQAVIDAEGRVSNLVVLHSVSLLDRAAIDAVQQWRYEPTIFNGRAVPVIMTVEVEFVLRP